MSDNATLLLTNTDEKRESAQPVNGIDGALGSAFNTRGRRNTKFLMGQRVFCRERYGLIIRAAKKFGCYDVLLNEKQVEISELRNKAIGQPIAKNSNVLYRTGENQQEAVVESIYTSYPPVAYIRVLLRDVPEQEISLSEN